MGKAPTKQKLAQNKVKLDEQRGANPDPADVIAAAGKTSKPSGPLTKEIDVLVARSAAIQTNQGRATASMRDHQGRLDKAETESAELSVRNMADPTPTNQELASDARIARNVILQEYDLAKHELTLIPGTLKKLKSDINRLQAEKRIQEKAFITSEIPDISKYRNAAIEALAQYAAYVCLTTERKTQYIDAKEIGMNLDKQRELSNRYYQIYNELESGMGFEKL